MFFESIEHNITPIVNINDGLITMKLIEAAQISLMREQKFTSKKIFEPTKRYDYWRIRPLKEQCLIR